MYDNLIGFITKAEDINSKGIDSIEGYSRFGTLLKVHKSDISGYRISQNKKIYNLNLIGLTFARYFFIFIQVPRVKSYRIRGKNCSQY